VSKRVILTLAALSLALAGCAQGWEDRLPQEPLGPEGLTAQPTSVALPGATNYRAGYTVGTGDRLDIKVYDQPELTGEYRVDGSGRISMPLISTISVAGQTTPEIERRIAAALRRTYLRDPSVSVQVLDYRPFYILGEVRTPGGYPYAAGMTVQNAVALGGGYSERADQGEVIVTRRTRSGDVTAKVPLTATIYPGDIVYVRERWF